MTAPIPDADILMAGEGAGVWRGLSFFSPPRIHKDVYSVCVPRVMLLSWCPGSGAGSLPRLRV